MAVKRIDPEEAKALLDSDETFTYLDVRSREEFQKGHVPGAVNVPFLNKNPAGFGMVPNPSFLQEVEEKFEKSDKIITGCLRGSRSLKAAEILVASGFTGVVDMRGGYDGEVDLQGLVVFPGWARRNLPTTTED